VPDVGENSGKITCFFDLRAARDMNVGAESVAKNVG